jgi:Secretion system C-terminal sorting domain/S1/P1 Nuclease
MIRRLCCVVVAAILFCSHAWSWGGATHKVINREAVKHLPISLTLFSNNTLWISQHAADADSVKKFDPTEQYKHFIDIDDYAEFKTGTLSHNIDSLIAKYGSSKVTSIGVVPWAIVSSLDSLTQTLRRGDSTKALQFAADLGHYVGDAHQPLHVTANYDGGQTGNSGIHSRYESSMMGTYLSQIIVTKDQVHFVDKPIDFAFTYITQGNGLVDSILHADNYAKATAGGSTSGSVYYAALWEKTGAMTKVQIQTATVDLACLWYTAAVNAGLISLTSVSSAGEIQPRFELLQNYPNPFNPTTTISFSLGSASNVTLKIYNLLGEEVETLVSGNRSAGTFRVQWKATGVASGIYLCRMQAGTYVETRKLILMK